VNERLMLPVALAMTRMLKVLDDHPELGCLGYNQWIGRTTLLVQYWRDFETLDHFTRDRELPYFAHTDGAKGAHGGGPHRRSDSR
jgi:hypothetical protein